MKLFRPTVKQFIERKDFHGLNQLLKAKPLLANEGITIPFDFFCRVKAHPLHRICDAVFSKKISDDEGVKLAKIFLEHGANIDGDKAKNEGTPLLAASSLHAEKLGIYYVEHGADIHHTSNQDGATALHWAAYCGLNLLVAKLILASAEINAIDNTYQSPPIGWSLQGFSTTKNTDKSIECIFLLLKNGASLKNLGKEKNAQLQSIAKAHSKLIPWLDKT